MCNLEDHRWEKIAEEDTGVSYNGRQKYISLFWCLSCGNLAKDGKMYSPGNHQKSGKLIAEKVD